ncbi:MAG: helix-turn-helix domain-containing protein [Peptococcia bacterium]
MIWKYPICILPLVLLQVHFQRCVKNEYVSLDVLVRICKALNCQLSEIVEVELDDRS